MKALTAAEMREVDRLTTERCGVASLQLMEAAGKHVAEAVLEAFAPEAPARVVVLCGKGNNGGDGLVAARHLKAAGAGVRVYLFGRREHLQGDAAANLQRWEEAQGPVECVETTEQWREVQPELARCEVIVDGLLGTGLRGPAEGLIAQAITEVNRISANATAARPRLIVAVDTPSGLPSDGQAAEGPVLRAHQTVTFTAPKIGQLLSAEAGAVGALLVRQIGSPPQLVEEIGKAAIRMAEPGEFGELPYVRAADSHKGSFGHVLLVCGSLGKGGAAALAGRGALRAGAGLVTIATADQVQASVAAGAAEYMAEALPSTDAGTISPASLEYGRFAKLLEGKSVLGVGPGLGTHLETQQFIRSIVRDATLPVVLDADGLNAFAGRGFELLGDRERTLAITPHPGEMARLLGVSASAVQANRLTTAQEASARWRIFVVLKGFHTLIVAPEGYAYVSTAGNAGLAKGGTGDTLTGVLAALTAQFGTRDWARVLALGVFLHGRAAELATAGKEPSGLLASEVCEFIPAARLELLRELQRSA